MSDDSNSDLSSPDWDKTETASVDFNQWIAPAYMRNNQSPSNLRGVAPPFIQGQIIRQPADALIHNDSHLVIIDASKSQDIKLFKLPILEKNQFRQLTIKAISGPILHRIISATGDTFNTVGKNNEIIVLPSHRTVELYGSNNVWYVL